MVGRTVIRLNICNTSIYNFFNPAAAEGGIYVVAPLYFDDDIVATRKDREAKLCTHLPKYLAEVLSKFGVDPI